MNLECDPGSASTLSIGCSCPRRQLSMALNRVRVNIQRCNVVSSAEGINAPPSAARVACSQFPLRLYMEAHQDKPVDTLQWDGKQIAPPPSPAPLTEVESLRVQNVNLERVIVQRALDDWQKKVLRAEGGSRGLRRVAFGSGTRRTANGRKRLILRRSERQMKSTASAWRMRPPRKRVRRMVSKRQHLRHRSKMRATGRAILDHKTSP